MSIGAIAAASSGLCGIQNQYQAMYRQIKQLGQDLQAGKLSKAQSDFVTLSQAASGETSGAGSIAQALNNVGTALQSGDLSAAQRAFTLLTKVGPNAVPNPHVPPMGSKITQGLDRLGQALQAGDLSAAQQAFASLQQLWRQTPATSTSATQTAAAASVSA